MAESCASEQVLVLAQIGKCGNILIIIGTAAGALSARQQGGISYTATQLGRQD
jgi:hypothetical protein